MSQMAKTQSRKIFQTSKKNRSHCGRGATPRFHHYIREDYAMQRNETPHHKHFPFDKNVAKNAGNARACGKQFVFYSSASPQIPAACRQNCGAVRCVALRNAYDGNQALLFIRPSVDISRNQGTISNCI